MGRLGPVLHGQNRFVLIDEGKVSDLALRHANRVLDDCGDNLLDRPVADMVEVQQRFHPLDRQGLFLMNAFAGRHVLEHGGEPGVRHLVCVTWK